MLVDYSHTPDSLASVLRAVRPVTAGRLLAVFGCGGDRDRGKRPLMGAVAADLADLAVVTSDNPRGEDPLTIIAEVARGHRRPPTASGSWSNPTGARRSAWRCARRGAGDALVIAGKGHETYQILGPETIHFDDREVAAAELAELGYASAAGGPSRDDRPARPAADAGEAEGGA